MPEWLCPFISVAFGIAGLTVGDFLGYRNGRVAGELAALKSM
jgi:hypothetical protein